MGGSVLDWSVSCAFDMQTRSSLKSFSFSGITFAAAIFRFCLPESEVFLRARAEEKARGEVTSGAAKSKAFLVSAKDALKQYWARCIYAVVLMSFFNFFS